MSVHSIGGPSESHLPPKPPKSPGFFRKLFKPFIAWFEKKLEPHVWKKIDAVGFDAYVEALKKEAAKEARLSVEWLSGESHRPDSARTSKAASAVLSQTGVSSKASGGYRSSYALSEKAASSAAKTNDMVVEFIDQQPQRGSLASSSRSSYSATSSFDSPEIDWVKDIASGCFGAVSLWRVARDKVFHAIVLKQDDLGETPGQVISLCGSLFGEVRAREEKLRLAFIAGSLGFFQLKEALESDKELSPQESRHLELVREMQSLMRPMAQDEKLKEDFTKGINLVKGMMKDDEDLFGVLFQTYIDAYDLDAGDELGWVKGLKSFLEDKTGDDCWKIVADGGASHWDQARAMKLIQIAMCMEKYDFAVKDVHGGGNIRELIKEMMVSIKVSHPNVGFCRMYTDPQGDQFLIMPFYSGGTLADRMTRVKTKEFASLMEGVAKGVQALNKAGVIHCDLKPVNILLDAVGKPKVADFGLSEICDPDEVKAGIGIYSNPGSPVWMAPESYSKARYSDKSDVWAVGAMILCYLRKKEDAYIDFNDQEEAKKRIRDGDIPGLREVLSGNTEEPLKELLKGCLAKDPAERWNWDQVIEQLQKIQASL